MSTPTILCLLAGAFWCTLMEPQIASSQNVLLLNQSALEEAASTYRAAKTQAPAFVTTLLAEAEKALTADLVSVVQKPQVPPSGDKHDYMSLGPYWWPDTTKPDGLPYVRRDGEVNPEYRAVGDNERIDRMVDNVLTLSLAYAISGDDRFAIRAIRQVRHWFLDDSTRMNPNLEYAQAIKGINQGRGIGIIETYAFRHLIDAMLILRKSEHWTPQTERGTTTWFSSYLTWLLESKNGKDEAGWPNNHGSAYDVQVSCIAFFLGKEDVAARILREVGMKRIKVQVEPDGSQPLELERTKSWSYAIMNLNALIELGMLAEKAGINLWEFTTPDGRSIRRAIEFLLPYALGEKKWTWQQIQPFHPRSFFYAARMGAQKYGDARFASAARALMQEEVLASRVMLYVPPLR